MIRVPWTALVVVLLGLAASRANADSSDVVEAALIRRTIVVLDEMTQAEREQLLPWLVNTISRQSDVHIESRLSEALDQKLAQLAEQANASATTQQEQPVSADEIGLAGEERESFQTLLGREQQAPASEEDLRKQIDALALVFDPKKPEVALNQAVEIAGIIERIQDPNLKTNLQRFLEDRLTALQAHL